MYFNLTIVLKLDSSSAALYQKKIVYENTILMVAHWMFTI